MTMAKSPSGFTLTELMIALVVFALAAGAIARVLITSQRVSRAQVEIISMQSNLRTGALVVPSELRELATDGTNSDILAMTSSNITFRAMRGLGFTCSVTSTRIKILDTGTVPFYGSRGMINGRDRIIVFVENDPDFPTDDTWLVLTPTAVDVTNNCGPRNAIMITVADFSGQLTNGISDIVIGGPVRSFEVMELGPVTSGGHTWLGARSVSGGQATLQPVLGPLETNGFGLEYFDAAGTTTTVPADVRQLRVTLRGSTEHAVSRGLNDAPAFVRDTLVATVTLRNGS
jgi:prepilin-type N-terminal cleavage/methylation domain-containing protein